MSSHRKIPLLEERIRQAETNWAFSLNIPLEQPDWGITVKFYSALHYLTAAAVRLGAPNPQSHTERFDYLSRVRIPRDIRLAFNELFENALTSRYDCEPLEQLKHADLRATDALERIRSYARGILQLEN
jgi:hypothetical protein